jgi:hypothetical protein
MPVTLFDLKILHPIHANAKFSKSSDPFRDLGTMCSTENNSDEKFEGLLQYSQQPFALFINKSLFLGLIDIFLAIDNRI